MLIVMAMVVLMAMVLMVMVMVLMVMVMTFVAGLEAFESLFVLNPLKPNPPAVCEREMWASIFSYEWPECSANIFRHARR